MVFNQKPRKPKMFTANSSKNTQGYCQPTKESIYYKLPLHTHNEDHFHHPQILKLASGTHADLNLIRDRKQVKFIKKWKKKLVQRQNVQSHINSGYSPATNLKVRTYV